MTLDLNSLFDTEKYTIPRYDSTKEELAAIAAGIRGMSVFLFDSSSVLTHPLYIELCQIAFELNLSIVIITKSEISTSLKLKMAHVFLTRPTELWRVPAYSLFKGVFEQYDWSNAAEHFEGMLLGYSNEDMLKWLCARADTRIGWTGKTVYLLLSSAQAISVRAHGKRYIDPEEVVRPIDIFFSRRHNRVRKDAENLILENITLARVSVWESFFRELFADKIRHIKSDIVTALLTQEKAAKMNSVLESNFQFFESGSWK